jgi:hypothetical protein
LKYKVAVKVRSMAARGRDKVGRRQLRPWPKNWLKHQRGRRKMVESNNIKVMLSLCLIEHMEKEESGQLHPLSRVPSTN